jgi:hypothetical protein
MVEILIRGPVVMIVMECEEDEEDEKGCMNIVAFLGDEADEDRQRSQMTPVGTVLGGGDQEVPNKCSGRGGSRSGRGQEAELGKVTLKSNGNEALSYESPLKSNGDEAFNDNYSLKSNGDEAFNTD